MTPRSFEECRRESRLLLRGHRARGWIHQRVCDAWLVRCQAYGYLPMQPRNAATVPWLALIPVPL